MPSPAPPELLVFDDPDALAAAAARRIADALRAGIAAENRATLALSGGATPGPTHRRLADEPGIDWKKVHVFWVDERCVPPDAPESNYRLARETLLDRVPIPDEQVYRMDCAGDASGAAALYDQGLKQFFGGQHAAFDVVVLGVGEDGHVASLFPGAASLKEGARWALHTEAPPPNPVRDRLTLTLPALDGARLALFVVTGEGKRAAVARVFDAYDTEPEDAPPAARVRPRDGTLVWLADAAAAGDLKGTN